MKSDCVCVYLIADTTFSLLRTVTDILAIVFPQKTAKWFSPVCGSPVSPIYMAEADIVGRTQSNGTHKKKTDTRQTHTDMFNLWCRHRIVTKYTAIICTAIYQCDFCRAGSVSDKQRETRTSIADMRETSA